MVSRILSKCIGINLIRNHQCLRKSTPPLLQCCHNLSSFSTPNNNSRPKLWGLPPRNFSKLPKTPELIYIPHVYRWLKTKIQFKYLQKIWDPEFTEGAFIYGTSKAVCRITEIIHRNTPEDLDHLLTPSAKVKLKELMKNKLTKLQKNIIKINPEDIKILVPMTIGMKNDKNEKNVKIGMRVLALKWIQPEKGNLKLVLVALQTEFFRDYTKGALPDWTISTFDVLDCVILSQVPHWHEYPECRYGVSKNRKLSNEELKFLNTETKREKFYIKTKTSIFLQHSKYNVLKFIPHLFYRNKFWPIIKI